MLFINLLFVLLNTEILVDIFIVRLMQQASCLTCRRIFFFFKKSLVLFWNIINIYMYVEWFPRKRLLMNVAKPQTDKR